VATFEESWRVRGELGHAADYLNTLRFAPEPSELGAFFSYLVP